MTVPLEEGVSKPVGFTHPSEAQIAAEPNLVSDAETPGIVVDPAPEEVPVVPTVETPSDAPVEAPLDTPVDGDVAPPEEPSDS